MKIKFTSTTLQLIRSHRTRLFSFCFVIMTLASANAQVALSQDDESEPVVVQVYDISEFVTQRTDQPFGGFVIPGISADEPGVFTGGGGQGGGGLGGGGLGGGRSHGGGGGGGVFRIAPLGPRRSAGSGTVSGVGYRTFRFGNVANPSAAFARVIMDSVASNTWERNGTGPGTINFLGTTMIVSQTPTNHKQIEALLKMLGRTKASSKNQSQVTINAIWLSIDEAQFATLAPKSDRSVNEDALKKLTEEFGRRGQITCFDGQSVHIAAGNLRSSVESVVPVVGQNELPGDSVRALAETNPRSRHMITLVSNSVPLAPDESIGGDIPPSNVGYQPVSRWTNYGAVLQVLPRVESDRKIWLDVSSIIVQPGDADTKTKVGHIDVDKLNMHCQQFMTSIRINDSTPTLIGGSAFDAAPQGKLQTYLILEASKVVKPAASGRK